MLKIHGEQSRSSTNIHDEERSARPTIVTDELVAKINEKIHENRRFTIKEFLLEFPQISRSLLHEMVTEKLGYHKFCARCVPKLLSEDHKKQCMAASLTFLEAYEKDGDSLLDRVVTGDETWVKHVTCETKTVYGVGTHTFSQKTKEMFANFVSKKDHGDCFLGQGGCASGGFPRTWFNNKL